MPQRRGTRLALLAVVALAGAAGSFALGAAAASRSRPPGGVLEQAAQRIASSSLQPVDREALDAAAIQGMLHAAGDPWGRWQGAAAPAGGVTYAGVGLWLRAGDGGTLVAQVAADSPAAAADVRPGDEISSVGGRAGAGAPTLQVAGWLRGAPGTAIDLVVARGGALRPVRLLRVQLPPTALGVRTLPAASGPVTVVTVPAFERGTGRQVRDAVAARPTDGAGVVLDLRGNGGGLLDEAVETASAFLPGGVVVRCTRRDGSVQQLDAVGPGDSALPVVVLLDGGSASASEVVAGALHDRGRAVLVGSRSYGKGTVQEPGTLADGSSLRVTVARYTTPAGRDLEGVGLDPDIEVAAEVGPEVALQRAVDVLSGLLASGTGDRG